jgi:chromosome segregation protein
LLRKISIHGFKSFCDRTEVAFGTGVTAIVGPNGCGKSNLVDALRWVLGEHNTRFLRCNRLEELIFTGTQRRKAMGMAEVRLLLDGVLDEGEWEIMRRFTRDGSGEYRINNKVCRWKDVYEGLLGTGLSHTGYVVIGQGTIQELAGGRPEDRRVWIEEASGVSRFRLSKKNVEDKLSAAARDIVRLNDLLAELEARKAALCSDWEVAARYHKLVNRRNDLEMAMWLHQEREESRRLQNLCRRLERYQSDIQESLSKEDVLKESIGPVEDDLRSTERVLKSCVNERESLAGNLLSNEKQRDSVRGKLALVSREIEARTARKTVLESDLEAMTGQEIELTEEREHVAKKYEESLGALSIAENERRTFETSWKTLGETVIDIRAGMVSLTGHLTELQRDRDDLRTKLEGKKRESIEIASRILSLEQHLSGLRKDLAENSQHLARRVEAEEEIRAVCESLEKKIESLKVSLAKVSSARQTLEGQLSRAGARKRLLEEMEKSFEGYGKGTRTILAAKEQGLLYGIVGAVGELFSCDSKHVKALSAAVGGAAENIVVSDEESAKRAIAFLQEGKGGRCTFLPLNLLKPRGLHPRAAQALSTVRGVRPLISVVKYPESLRTCAEYLLSRVVLADTIDDALAFMKESSWVTRVVTMSGENIEPGGAITGGEAPRHEAIFLRKQELELLGARIKEESRELRGKQAQIRLLEEELSELLKRLTTAKEDWVLAKTQVSGLRNRISEIEKDVESSLIEIQKNQVKIAPLKIAEQRFASGIEELIAKEKTVLEEVSRKEDELIGYETQIKEYLSIDQNYSDRITNLSRDKEEVERRLAAIARRLESLKGERSSTQKILEEERKELARLEELKDELILEESSLKQSISSLDKRMGAVRTEISTLEAKLDSLRNTLNQKLGQIESHNRERASLESKIADGRTELENLQKSLSGTRQLIFSKYRIEKPGDYEHTRMNREEALKQIEEIEASIHLLGTVNLKAEKDYMEISDRIEHIQNEKADVEAAMEELGRTKEFIEEDIQKRFLETFHKVDESFQQIFRDLFGGGRGKLNIVEDTLGVEVIAEPPGRRQKQFNLLSGGERSLCGIALIFAILSVKPSPVMILDEVDSSLDEANVVRFAQFLKKYSKDTQFVVITHQESTMEAADIIYGVTMEEPGVSKIFSMRLENR